jgi:catechol 2,3-dioxygenase-like lactoylglutathione lyase family enzyme
MPATLTKPSKKNKKASKPAPKAKKNGAKAAKAKIAPKAAAKPKDALQFTNRVIFYVKDFSKAVEFYTKTLGLELAYPADGGWAELKTGACALSIHGTDEAFTPNFTSVSFAVTDFEAARNKLIAKGVAMGPIFEPCGTVRCSSFKDLDGNHLCIEGTTNN